MFTRRTFPVLALVAAAFAGVLGWPFTAAAQEKTVTVFAAASMKNALDDVNAAFTKQTGIKVVASYAASSALMKQIEHGAPADVFALRRPRLDGLRLAEKAHQGRHAASTC